MGWRNRIVGHGEKPARDFLANPANWRIHSAEQQSTLDGVLTGVGWVATVTENSTTGHLLDGHMRVLEALKQGEDTLVPYTLVELSLEEEALVLATFDPLGTMASADAAQINNLLTDIQSDNAAIQSLLGTLAQDAGAVPADTTEEPELCPTCGKKMRRKK